MLSAKLAPSVSPSPESTLWMTSQDNVGAQNRKLLLVMKTNQRRGKGCLPFYLGLTPLDFVSLGVELTAGEQWFDFDEQAFENGSLRQELLTMRQDECADLYQLLLANQSGPSQLGQRLASIVTAGCMGGDHLWKDLGLDSRDQLSRLMELNFEPLFKKNDKDMKWKKFFYKQLCEQEGGYVCRAPTCEQCAAYDDCFGPEN